MASAQHHFARTLLLTLVENRHQCATERHTQKIRVRTCGTLCPQNGLAATLCFRIRVSWNFCRSGTKDFCPTTRQGYALFWQGSIQSDSVVVVCCVVGIGVGRELGFATPTRRGVAFRKARFSLQIRLKCGSAVPNRSRLDLLASRPCSFGCQVILKDRGNARGSGGSRARQAHAVVPSSHLGLPAGYS
jgi:hypothetical protein